MQPSAEHPVTCCDGMKEREENQNKQEARKGTERVRDIVDCSEQSLDSRVDTRERESAQVCVCQTKREQERARERGV